MLRAFWANKRPTFMPVLLDTGIVELNQHLLPANLAFQGKPDLDGL